ncbi:MAG: FecR domain-containing protein [Candidatus Binatia bacterium]
MKKLTLAAILLSFATVQGAVAAETIGYVKTVSGKATVVRQGSERPLAVGAPLFENDTLKTGEESSLGVTMKDGTTLSAGPETEILLDKYAYAPKAGQLGFVARVSQGTLDFVSGMLGKLAPESVAIETPTGVIGMRGTHFVVRVAPGQKFADESGTKRGAKKG